MALVKCKECEHKISKKAKACPNCGAVRKRSILGRLVKYSLIAIVAFFGIGVVMESNKQSNMTPDEKTAYLAELEQRKADREVERIAKAAEKAKAKEEAQVAAEAKAADKAKAEEEARIVAEAEAADKAKAEEEARIVAEAEAAEIAKAEAEIVEAEKAKRDAKLAEAGRKQKERFEKKKQERQRKLDEKAARGGTEDCGFEVPKAGRAEHRYGRLSGVLAPSRSRSYYEELPSYPFKVTSMVETGPEKWAEQGENFDSRTLVTVLEQKLKHRSHGFYEGVLLVRVQETGEEIHINHQDFSPVRYWECPLEVAMKYTDIIVETTSPETKGVSRSGDWVKLGNEKRMVCQGVDYYKNKRNEPSVECVVFKDNSSIKAYFSLEELTLVY